MDQPTQATIADVERVAGDLWHEARAHQKAAALLAHGHSVGDLDAEQFATAIADHREIAREAIGPMIDALSETLAAFAEQRPIAEAGPRGGHRLIDIVGGGLIR